MRRSLVVGGVGLALAAVVWFKPGPAPTSQSSPTVTTAQSAGRSVLLFADPREAESSCGCAEVIRLARGAGGPSVAVQEFDTRQPTDAAQRYSIRVSPTVIIAATDGREVTRFEGESADVIASLRAALDELQPEPGRLLE